MIYDLVPEALHHQLDEFRQKLAQLSSQQIKNCPFCKKEEFYTIRSRTTYTYHCKSCHKYFTAATSTLFNRLTPFSWLDVIFTSRIKNENYSTIAEKLGCSFEKIKRRDKIITDYLQANDSAFYHWYTSDRQTQLTPIIIKQHHQLKEKIASLLDDNKAICVYCNSTETVKVGARTSHRCKRCRQSFNTLSGTALNRLPKVALWLPFIDLLVAGKNNVQIGNELKLSGNTVSKWRKIWCGMMVFWNYKTLAIWCERSR